MTDLQKRVLTVLSESPDEWLSSARIGTQIGIIRASEVGCSIAYLIREKSGFVDRRGNYWDGVEYRITAAGLAELKGVEK